VQGTVVEKEVNVKIFIVNLDAPLPSYKSESGTKFQQKRLKFAQDCILQVLFQITVFQAKEV
jgi:hypothetical protein